MAELPSEAEIAESHRSAVLAAKKPKEGVVRSKVPMVQRPRGLEPKTVSKHWQPPGSHRIAGFGARASKKAAVSNPEDKAIPKAEERIKKMVAKEKAKDKKIWGNAFSKS